VQAILDGVSAPVAWPKERLFKAALLLGVAFSVGQLVRRALAWSRAGRPIRLAVRASAHLAWDVLVAALVIFGIPRFVGVPLRTMFEYFPDLGVALVASAAAGVVAGVLRAWTPAER
jgi:hypothetical protein